MGRVKGFIDSLMHSGGRKSREGQQPGGVYGQQQQPQHSNARSKLRSLSPFPKTPRSACGATSASHAQSPTQSSTVTVVNDTMAPASGRISIVAASSGKPEDLATAIPVSNLLDSVATTIAPVLQTSSIVSQAVEDTNCKEWSYCVSFKLRKSLAKGT
ncbi:hypothetical protein EV426DRAFT_607906 [Tirmania nivea]|nr:hypothetical protein EV426DRAFT_607906 [Tirmania nivea]